MGGGISLNSPSKIHSSLLFHSPIGQGGFSIVYLGRLKKNDNYIAIKKIHIKTTLKHSKGILALKNELNIFKKIGKHENIVKLHYAYRLDSFCYFVMDYLIGGDLRHFMLINGKLSQNSITYIISSLGSALHHLHMRGIMHRDIKPENIGFDIRGRPCLTDFGISFATDTSNPIMLSSESSGTLAYLAPEILTKTHDHSYQSDFWSLGVVAYELLYGKRPFDPHTPVNYIYFVANHYHKIWEYLHMSSLSSSSSSSSSFSWTEQHIFDHITQETSNYPHTPNSISPIENSYNNYNNNTPLPFPEYHVTLNPDGSLPESLIVPLALTRNYRDKIEPEVISEEIIELLHGLLDVRIPERLGSMTNYNKFSQHSAFKMNGYDNPKILGKVTSPILKEDWYGVLSGQSPTRSIRPKSDYDSFDDKFPTEVEEELKNFFYCCDIEDKQKLSSSEFDHEEDSLGEIMVNYSNKYKGESTKTQQNTISSHIVTRVRS